MENRERSVNDVSFCWIYLAAGRIPVKDLMRTSFPRMPADTPIGEVVQELGNGRTVTFLVGTDGGLTHEEIMADPKLRDDYLYGNPNGEGEDWKNSGNCLGAITPTSIHKHRGEMIADLKAPARKFWTSTGREKVVTVCIDQPVSEAIRLMVETKCQNLPVTKPDGYVVGYLAMDDIVHWLMTAPVEKIKYEVISDPELNDSVADVVQFFATTPIEELGWANPVHQAAPDDLCADAEVAMQKSGQPAYVVLDSERKPVGLCTASDSLQNVKAEIAQPNTAPTDLRVSALMITPVECVLKSTPVIDVLHRMVLKGRHRDILVDENGRFVTLVSFKRFFTVAYEKGVLAITQAAA